MLAGSGLTICPDCGLVVPVITGLCELCGQAFPPSTIQTHVAELMLEAA